MCAGNWQINSSAHATGPANQEEQNLGVFQSLLHTLFTTKSEFLIAFKDHHLRASLFIKLSLDTFVVTLHRMTSPMSAAAWWSSVLGFVRSSVTLSFLLFVTSINQTVCIFECYIIYSQAPRGA